MESCLVDLRKTYVNKLINGALTDLRRVFCFTCIVNEFEEEKVRLEEKIRTLKIHGKVETERDKDIQDSIHYWKEKASKLIQEDIKTKQTCFFGLCPNCIWQYKKGKELINNIKEIKRSTKHGENLESGFFQKIEYSWTNYILFQSRESKYQELLDALKDDNKYIIVLQGMWGIGKTQLAQRVGKQLKRHKQFDHVIMTSVSFTPDTKKIQADIAGCLGLDFDNCNDSYRRKKLWSRLTNGEKILLILDDVWDQGPPLDFDLIGIPNQSNHKDCRVLITTRSKQVFNIMGCDKMIELELLSEEEAWTMFKAYAGISDNDSKYLITRGHKIAKECKQLPIAIAVIARSLKGQKYNRDEWDATLKSLEKHVSMLNDEDEMVTVYKSLKSSYDYMKDEKVKGLLLLSSLFPKDKEIPIEILTRLGIGTSLFGEDYGSYEDARNQVIVAKNKLMDSYLLVGVDEEHVKMHELVREATQWIANKEIPCVNLSNKNLKSLVQREMNIKYLFCEGKNVDLFSYKYDGSKLETLIVDVEIDEDRKCIEVPNSFFENMIELQVLYILGHDEQPLSLPHSTHSLKNIRSMLVDGVDLGDISVLGNLHSLETLDLVGCKINELPHEIANIWKFKLLNLEECEIRRNDPFKVIERCSTLEELYFIRSFNDFCREITFPMLQRYCIHKGQDAITSSLSKYVSFDVGDDECFFSKETLKYCMQTTEVLQINGIKEGWKNLMPEIVPIYQGMNNLVELRLRHISQLQCLISTMDYQVPNILSKLVILKLDTMENLVELFNGSIYVESLKNLKKLSIKKCKMFIRLFNCALNLCNLKTVTLQKCPMLVSLSPLLTSRNLLLLEKLKIAYCEGLKNLVDDNDNDDKSHGPMFPKLKVFYIEGCCQLESIFPLLSFQDLPILEIISIKRCDEVKYIFGQYQHVEPKSLKQIELCELPNFMSIFPKYTHSTSSPMNESSSTSGDVSQAHKKVDPIKCNIFSWITFHGYRQKVGSMSSTKTSLANEDPLQNNSTASVSSSHRLQVWEHVRCFQGQSSILCNVKEITLSYILKIKSVLIRTISPIMLVETLTIKNCHDLKHIIVDIEDYESGDKNWGNVFPKLKRIHVQDCMQLKYIFGHYIDDLPNNNKIHLHLPALQCLKLCNLPSLVSMCHKQYHTIFPLLKELILKDCSLDNTIIKLIYIWERAQCLPVLPYIMCNIKEITSSGFSEIKSMFMLSNTPTMLVETLRIENCEELKHIIVDNGVDENGGNNWDNVFPKLDTLSIQNCGKLEYIFAHYTEGHPNHNEIHLHLPALQCLKLCNVPNLVAMCPKPYRTTFSHLKKIECSLDYTIMKVQDKASQFQKKGCDHYQLLEIKFNKNNATELVHRSSTQDPPNTNKENELDNQYFNNGSVSHVRDDNNSSNDDLHEVEHITCSGKRQVQLQSQKELTSQMIGEAFSAFVKASLAKVERHRDRSVEDTSRVTSDYSLTKCVTVLDEMEDIPNDAYGKALKMFMNPNWREVFIAMSVERKRGWVLTL